jgi:hypothetical protein
MRSYGSIPRGGRQSYIRDVEWDRVRAESVDRRQNFFFNGIRILCGHRYFRRGWKVWLELYKVMSDQLPLTTFSGRI